MEEIKKDEKCTVGCCKMNKDTIIWILSGLLVLAIGIAISMSLCRHGDGFRKFNREQGQGEMRNRIERGEGEGRRSGEGRMMNKIDNVENQPSQEVVPTTEVVPQVDVAPQQ